MNKVLFLLIFLFSFVIFIFVQGGDYNGDTNNDYNSNAIRVYNLGTMYYHGLSSRPVDKKKACDLFERSFDLGYYEAAFNLAHCYRRGEGVEKDIDKAALLYRTAAENGVDEALTSLAVIYLNEEGFEENSREGIDILFERVDEGDEYAAFHLGNEYYAGRHVEKDYYEAINYYKLAANEGHSLSISILYLIYSKGIYGQNVDMDKSRYYSNLFCGVEKIKGDGWTIEFALAGAYKYGWGVDVDLEKYEELIREHESKENGEC